MAEHTPGPWRSESPYVSAPSGEHRKIVADCDQHFSDDECEANTRLIAAAPELLAALTYCEVVMDEAARDQMRKELTNAELGKLWTDTLAATRAALAKARGEADPTSADEVRTT